MNALLWGIAIILIGAGIFGNYHFSDKSLLLRVLGMLAAFGVALYMAALTSHGRRFVRFVQESKLEVRKVVWPNRQETMQMTGIVLVMVTIVGILLWGIDAALLRLIGWITGIGS